MNSSIRNIALATLLAVGGGLVGPHLGVGAAPTDSAKAASISTGPRSVFIPISSYRAYDSRNDTFQGKIDARDAGDPGRNQRPVFAGAEEGGSEILFDLVPGEVVAVTYNVQAVQTEGSGFMHIDGFGAADGSASTLTWTRSGEQVSNSGVALLTSAFDDSGFLGVYVGGGTGRAHVIIDITGYYVAI